MRNYLVKDGFDTNFYDELERLSNKQWKTSKKQKTEQNPDSHKTKHQSQNNIPPEPNP